MHVEGPGQAVPHATKDNNVVPQSFKKIERGQRLVLLKKGSHRARYVGLASKVNTGKVPLIDTKGYTKDIKENVTRQ